MDELEKERELPKLEPRSLEELKPLTKEEFEECKAYWANHPQGSGENLGRLLATCQFLEQNGSKMVDLLTAQLKEMEAQKNQHVAILMGLCLQMNQPVVVSEQSIKHVMSKDYQLNTVMAMIQDRPLPGGKVSPIKLTPEMACICTLVAPKSNGRILLP